MVLQERIMQRKQEKYGYYSSSRCINSHYSAEREQKKNCSYYSMFDISSCSVFTAQTARGATSESNLFAASDKPKTSSHPFYPKDTLTLLFCEGAEGMRGGESFQQLQRQFHWVRAAFHSLHCYSVYEIIWVWTWILWASGPGPSICRGGNVKDGQGPHQFFKRALFIKKQKQNWYLSSCCPVGFCCCYNVASVCCQLQHQHPPHTIKPQSPWWCTWHRYQHHKHIHKQTHTKQTKSHCVTWQLFFFFFLPLCV